MEVIGTVSAIIGVIDVATRSISTLADIRKRYKLANMAVELLTSQLETIKTALDQIRLLIEESLQDDQHHQLIMSTDITVKSCNLLIRVLDEQISKIEYDEDKSLTIESRIKIVLESKGTDECLARLDRQMTALSLLITAYTARNINRQQDLMKDKKSQKIFEQVKDDSSSLYVLCDSASFLTKKTMTTTATSKFSINFGFDAELLQTRAYKNTFRALLRKAGGLHNQSTTNKLAKKSRKTMKVLILGTEAAKFTQFLKITQSGSSVDERKSYCMDVCKSLLSELSSAMDAIAAADTAIRERPAFQHHKLVLDSSLKDGAILERLDAADRQSLKWCADCADNNDSNESASSGSYFIKNSMRILEPGYIPSVADIVQVSPVTSLETFGTTVDLGAWSIRVLHQSSIAAMSPNKGIEVFHDMASTIFTVDLSRYDEILVREPLKTPMTEALSDFELTVNSRWLRHKPIILLLCNAYELRAKIKTSPFEKYWPDYAGGNDFNSVLEYIFWRFLQVNRNQLICHAYLSDFSDDTSAHFFVKILKDAIVESQLRVVNL